MAKTRYEWTLTRLRDLVRRGGHGPRLRDLVAEQVAWILSDSGAVAVVAETPAHAATVDARPRPAPGLRHVLVDRRRRPRAADRGRRGRGRRRARARGARPLERRHLATLIYTSGTTGRPKGCELTHGNFLFDLAVNAVPPAQAGVAHPGLARCCSCRSPTCFARFIQVRLRRTARAGWATPPTSRTCVDDLGAFQPTFVLAVPRVFEKVYNSAKAKAEADGKGRIFDAAAATAIAYSTRAGHRPARARPAGPARAVRPARLRQAARTRSAAGAVRRLRRRPAGRAARPLLPRHRRHRARGLRPDRDDGAPPRSTRPTRSGSARSGGRCRASACASPTTASCSCAAATCCAAT